MVMMYAGVDFRKYLRDNFSKLSFNDKLDKLNAIVRGLYSIHEEGLVHKDFHMGNMLRDEFHGIENIHITDLGLCRPANETNKEKVYGVIPYVAPEVLKGQSYSQASDIYSFGMVAYEVLTGLPPYMVYDNVKKHYTRKIDDSALKKEVRDRGLRPQFQVRVPQLLENLINECWDADPKQRPTAKELYCVLVD